MSLKRLLGSIALLACLNAIAASSCLADEAIVVRPASWSDSLQAWKQYRSQQGTEVYELDAELGQVEIQKQIRELKSQHPAIKFLLLAGDVSAQKTTIPTFYKSSSAMVQFRGPPTIATDNPYADLDGDEIPDLIMGRLPADSGEQLAQALGRVIAYESQPAEVCQRDVHIVAGVGGFGMLADSVIEMTTKSFLSDRIPGWSNVSMTQASLNSNYCPDPRAFDEACINRFNSGSAFWVYIGHGHVENLDYLRVKEQEYLPILHVGHLPAMRCAITKSPIAVFLACYTGAFDAQRDSLAERLVLKPDGAIAAIASTRVSGPYGLAMLSNGLLDQFYQQRTTTLGEIVHLAKRSMLEENVNELKVDQVVAAKSSRQLKMIESIASAMSPEDYDLRQERLEHVWEMHLIGDPLLRPRYPNAIKIEVPKRIAPGQELVVKGELANETKLQVELAYRRQDLPSDIAREKVDADSAEGRKNYQGRYEMANSKVIARIDTVKTPGQIELKFDIPTDLPRGRYCIRAFGTTAAGWSTGYAEFTVRPESR